MVVLGIDLGTTYSACAVFQDGASKLIPNALGDYLTPSVVGLSKENNILVGDAAKELIGKQDSQVVYGFKRYMGTLRKFSLGKNQLGPEELSSFILKKLKKDAEDYLQQNITEAVISVPAYFHNKQRTAVKIAGELAGLKVERLINEPTAAALHYGIANLNKETKYFIFDIGGGTFDVSIIELFNGVLEVRATAGDNYLGGDDFTTLLAKHIIIKCGYKIDKLSNKEYIYFWQQAERLKKNLYKENEVTIDISINKENFSISITRMEAENVYSPLLSKIIIPIRRALNDAQIHPSALDAILLVGGSTKIHVIPKICSQIFKKIGFCFEDPQLVVALGAAAQAELKSQNTVLKEVILTDVSAYSLGVSAVVETQQELEYFPIIERNCILPVSKVKRFYTSVDNQKQLIVDIYQGESRKVENNVLIGMMTLRLPNNIQNGSIVDIRFTYDINGILEVQISMPQFNINKIEFFRESSGNLSEKEIKSAMEKLNAIKIHPREQESNTLIILKAERLYEETLGEAREIIASMIRNFQSVLDSQDLRLIEDYRTKFTDFLCSIDKYHDK